MERVIIFVTCIQQILCHRICKLRKTKRDESALPDVFLNKLRFKSIFLLFRFFWRKLSGAPVLSSHSLPEAWPPTNGLLGNSRSFQHSSQICNSVFQELKHRCRSHGIGLLTDGRKPNFKGAGTFVLTLWEMDVDETQIVRPAQQARAAADDQWCRLPAIFTP